MPQGLSIRAFAKADGCSEKLVRRKLQSGHLAALADGSIDPALVGTPWRRSTAAGADSADTSGPSVRRGADSVRGDDAEALGEIAERILETIQGSDQPLLSKAEAERLKENCIAYMRQIDLDKARGEVAEIEEIATAVAGEYAVVRSRLTNVGAKVAPRVAVMRSAEEIKALIDEEIAAALKELTLDQGGRVRADAAVALS